MRKRTLFDTHPRTILFGLLSISSLVATGWFAVEDTMLARNERPITWFARVAVNRYRKAAYTGGCAGAFIVGVAVCHFILDADREPVSGRLPSQPLTAVQRARHPELVDEMIHTTLEVP